MAQTNKNELFTEYPYGEQHLRMILYAMVDAILPENYYNYGMDVYTCDELCAYDILNRYNHKAAERYEKILIKKVQDYRRNYKKEQLKKVDEEAVNKLVEELFKK